MRTGRAEIAEARARQGAAEARRAALAAQVDEEVAGAHARYLAARSQVARYADLAPRLAELNALYERGLAAGEIDLTAFLAARDRMLRTSAAALAARRDAAVAAAALEAAVGGDFRGTAR